MMRDLWSNGLWLECDVTGGLDGFAVYTNCEDEAPDFRGFFVSREDAERFAFHSVDDEGEPFYEPTVELAVVTDRGVIVANDFELRTHAQLRARIADVMGGDRGE